MPNPVYNPAHHLIENEPYYEAVGEEIQLFEAAYRQQIPVWLKGPTGCNDAAGALFEDIAPILGNFVCGLSGRRLKLEEGDAAWTDGERIVLPPLIAVLPNLDDSFQLAKITVALLWAQTRFGTLRIDYASVAPTMPTPSAP